MTDADSTHRDALIRRHEAGEPLQFCCFWKHQLKVDGVLDPACFSQWYPSPFHENGNLYKTAEHYMMAAKARLFGDTASEQAILASDHPAAVQKLGRGVQGFDGRRWEQERFAIVCAGSRLKFSSTPALTAFLLSTGDAVLVEASPVDRIWGIGLGAESPEAANPSAWRGLNLLGFALMDARSRLAAQVLDR
jgi:ribA/ribD-fused uncharacterized protein